MTDTGQIPGEGQPENAGGQPEVQQPGMPAAGPYPYAGPVDAAVGAPGTGAAPGGEEDLLLPGSQGAWNEVQPGAGMQDLYGQQDAYAQHDPYGPPSPYVQQAQQQPHAQPHDQTQPVPGAQQYATPTASHTPGPHETDGRDSGAFDYGAVRASLDGQEPPAPDPGPADAPGGQEAAAPEAAPETPVAETPAPHPPRRPLHLGPPEPEQSGAVRPLSDRGIGNSSPGPAQNSAPAPGSGPVPPAPQQPSAAQPEVAEAQAAQAAAAHAMQQQTEGMAQQGEFTPQQGPPTSGPEYLDFDYESPDSLPGPQLGALPPHDEQWAYQGHKTAEGATADHAQQAGYVAGPQLAPSAADMGLQQDPSQAGGPVESPGPIEPAGASQPAPDPADGAAAASEERQPEPDVAGQDGQEGGDRRRRGSNDSGTESTGNTWVSTPGSTAVEPIEPPARDAEQSAAESHGPGDGDGAAPAETDGSEQQSAAGAQQSGDRSGQAETAVPAPGSADAAGIPAQHAETDVVTPDAHIPAPAPAQEQPEQGEAEGQQKTGPAGETPSAEEAGTAAAASGSETVAGIPAQQQAEHSDAPAADGQPGQVGQAANGEAGTPESEAGWHDAAAMVPRQGQHVEQEAESAAVRAANDGENTSQPEATAATAAAGQEQQQETEQTTDSGAAPLMNEDGPAADADPEGDGTTPASAPGDVESPQAPVGPPAPGFADDERDAVHRLMRERRDIRNGFRPDPIPHEVLLRVLEAAHTAPSVGHSQPWDFVVIRSEETRRAMHELAERQRDAYAKSLPKGRAKQFKEMKIEAILDTPVNIVVTADSTRGGRHTLGRHTQPQMAPYSSALAVENLWLAARAEGLGVGWVSFFDEREMVRALELPDHLEVVAYLCVGYVDEFPPEPELAQAGWSKRRPLSWVVHEESYGRRVLPGAEPQDLLSDTVAAIRPLDAKALGEAWERQKRMTKPSGALGMLEIISAQLCGLSRKCPPPSRSSRAITVCTRRASRRGRRRSQRRWSPTSSVAEPSATRSPIRSAPKSVSSMSEWRVNSRPRLACCPERCGRAPPT